MKLTPHDIRHMEFGRAAAGYNRQQVHDFLERVAREIEVTEDEVAALHEQLEEHTGTIDELRTSEVELKRAVIAAERIANEIRENAKREAELRVEQAEQRGATLLREAEQRAQALLDDARKTRAARLSELQADEAELHDDIERRRTVAEREVTRLEHSVAHYRQQFRSLLEGYLRALDLDPLPPPPPLPRRAPEDVEGSLPPPSPPFRGPIDAAPSGVAGVAGAGSKGGPEARPEAGPPADGEFDAASTLIDDDG